MPRRKDHFATTADQRARGAGPATMRLHNERLLLGMLHSAGQLSAADLSRLTGLSAQAVSVILRNLDEAGLILRGAPLRGKIGQPSVPLTINPDGAFVLGAKVGRRSAEIVLVGLDGRVRAHRWRPYGRPDPTDVLIWLEATARELAATVPRVAGIGVALPFRLWDWAEEAQDGHAVLEGWRSLDLSAALSALPFLVSVVNDGSAACAAEMTFGALPHGDDVIYLFLGTFIGGGLAQRGRLVLGPTGNAGAFGSVLVQGGADKPRQLIEVASLIGLERALQGRGEDPRRFRMQQMAWNMADPFLDDWLSQAARGIAEALISIAATTGAPLAIIDGAMPPAVLDTLIARVQAVIAHLPQAGIDAPGLRRGTLGARAPALGAAALILNERFLAWPAELRRLDRHRPGLSDPATSTR
ncbi:MAG: ROK family transcriptional regulator [Gemmobacter sp.]